MADGITIKTNARRVAKQLREIEKELRADRGAFDRVVMREAAKKLRKLVRTNLRTGGQGSWAPLARSTRERTGRTLPLSTLVNRIRFRSRARGTRYEVYFLQRSPNWDLTQHHNGYRVSATRNTRMAWRLAAGGTVVISNRKAFSVPARKVWPSQRKVNDIVLENLAELNKVLERITR